MDTIHLDYQTLDHTRSQGEEVSYIDNPRTFVQQDRNCQDRQLLDHIHIQVGDTCTGHTHYQHCNWSWDHQPLDHSHSLEGRGVDMCNPYKHLRRDRNCLDPPRWGHSRIPMEDIDTEHILFLQNSSSWDHQQRGHLKRKYFPNL